MEDKKDLLYRPTGKYKRYLDVVKHELSKVSDVKPSKYKRMLALKAILYILKRRRTREIYLKHVNYRYSPLRKRNNIKRWYRYTKRKDVSRVYYSTDTLKDIVVVNGY